MEIFAAVDIGGTAIKYGIVDETGRVLSSSEEKTEASAGVGQLVAKVELLLGRLLDQNPGVAGIGISTAGVVDPGTGRIIYANDNLPGYTGTVWKKPLKEKFKVPVLVNNDVNAAALAEAWVGAAKGVDNFFCVTVGTGIGGAAFINGKLLEGAHYRAAEIGNMTTDDSGARFERQASTSALVGFAEAESGESGLDGRVVFQKIRSGAQGYCAVYDKWIKNLCRGIADVLIMFDPAMLVIGGGISREGNFFIDKIKEGLCSALPDQTFLDSLEIVPAACGNSAGIIGAVSGFVHEDK